MNSLNILFFSLLFNCLKLLKDNKDFLILFISFSLSFIICLKNEIWLFNFIFFWFSLLYNRSNSSFLFISFCISYSFDFSVEVRILIFWYNSFRFLFWLSISALYPLFIEFKYFISLFNSSFSFDITFFSSLIWFILINKLLICFIQFSFSCKCPSFILNILSFKLLIVELRVFILFVLSDKSLIYSLFCFSFSSNNFFISEKLFSNFIFSFLSWFTSLSFNSICSWIDFFSCLNLFNSNKISLFLEVYKEIWLSFLFISLFNLSLFWIKDWFFSSKINILLFNEIISFLKSSTSFFNIIFSSCKIFNLLFFSFSWDGKLLLIKIFSLFCISIYIIYMSNNLKMRNLLVKSRN